MKRILINATHNEEVRVALCKDSHLYDFDLENRTREQKKSNIYKGHITRIEPSLEAVFVEYGSARQGFLPLREIAPEYLRGNPREDNIKQLLKEGDELIVQVEKEERGNKGAALSTYLSLAGRYLVLMPNNAKAGGISRQISGKVREETRNIIANLNVPEGMSVIVRTAGLGKGFDELQNDLAHLLDTWSVILDCSKKHPSPCLMHQEAGVVTRAMRDYLRDDIGEVWIDSENAYNEAAGFIAAVMPNQMNKLRKYTDFEPLFTRFGVERQIESAYQREVRLPSGGSIVIDQTEAMVSIDINSSKSTKGADVAQTAYHTNLEAAEEIARQLRLRDMGGLIVIDFIDMNDPQHQKDVEKRLIDATRYDRARVQFAEISKFGLMQMSRQRLRPSLEEATGYICPRCHGNGMIRDLRSLALSIMRQIEQIALKERMGEIQAEVPTEIAAFLLNEKRESLVYLEQDSGARITVLPHAHLESPNFRLHFNPDGFAPSSYERIVDTEEKEAIDRGYDVNWQTKADEPSLTQSRWQQADSSSKTKLTKDKAKPSHTPNTATAESQPQAKPQEAQPQAVAWLSNLFAPKPQAKVVHEISNQDAAAAIESIVNGGGVSLGAFGVIAPPQPDTTQNQPSAQKKPAHHTPRERTEQSDQERKPHKPYYKKSVKREQKEEFDSKEQGKKEYQKREVGSHRESRGEMVRGETLKPAVAEKVHKEPRSDKKESVKDVKETQKSHTKEQEPKKDVENAQPNSVVSKEVMIRVKTTQQVPAQARTVRLSLENQNHGVQESIKIETEEKAQNTVLVESAKELPNQEQERKAIPQTSDVVDEVLALDSTEEPKTQTPSDELCTDDGKLPKQGELPKQEELVQSLKSDGINHNTQRHLAQTMDLDKLTTLAQAMNRAVNDPRVVKIAHQPMSITGTAGEFIRQMLDGTMMTDNFVLNFLRALVEYNQKTKFEFANYGYVPLTDDYLTAFHDGMSAVGQYSTTQGKTIVNDRPPSRRASNDPRGEHPSFCGQANEQGKVLDCHMPSSQVSNQQLEIALESESPAEETFPQSVATVSLDDTSKSADALKEILAFADETIQHVMERLHLVSDDVCLDEQSPSTKTDKKANSYKDMIENVSGQLLQPTGILSLVAPKKPKPKPAKSPVRKTSKAAQKAQVVKRKASSDESQKETK